MPRMDLGEPYNQYIQGLVDTGLYDTYDEVVKDALRKHMIHAAIAEGEADIQAGRMQPYSPELIDRLTAEIIAHG